uniref:energy transducer TonB n=1 Tax=Flavobacterium daejeonense TaxID=350893 RepID=UPI00068CE5E0|nr:energy transducer TonB [Flavobacterium daejeonense]
MRTGKHLLKIFFVFTILLSSKNTIAQSDDADDALYSTTGIEVKPTFPGGINEFYQFIGKNFQTPKVEGLKGKIYITFVIEKDGSVMDIKILRDIGYGTGEEAVRVLKECPKWNPGIQNGKVVRVLYSLPININTVKEQSTSEPIYSKAGIESPPNFIGGEKKLNEYVKQNFKVPAGCPEGKIPVSFVVEKDGVLSEIKILTTLFGHDADEEAIRVLKNSPKWNPGLKNNQAVRVLYTLLISVKGSTTTTTTIF